MDSGADALKCRVRNTQCGNDTRRRSYGARPEVLRSVRLRDQNGSIMKYCRIRQALAAIIGLALRLPIGRYPPSRSRST